MCKCDNCGSIFEEPDTKQDYRGEFWGVPAYETIGICPFCGDDDIDYEYKMQEDDEESFVEEPDYAEEDAYFEKLGVFN